ncbi:MAG: isochorismatase family protein [Candidatus Nanoarchaeia archaeon]|nr:isochorismatase family protein [Candidatus Haiyanarchaeum thermophilum]MCW1303129.1 isochorismatase family protein [Candidatus Haiyanarchaeum thermophilum]MCW1303794.1 isochorismatase family protein [Candidatus Haiyanarchaeum thermophilum]MCW1306591.1 isochorismatase family protein [Candidatus Haiyanarchaeum thermophilum]MCW1307003.1 isochorismatase family protein [Candidatus Haiyanarchaeum thermophilum]
MKLDRKCSLIVVDLQNDFITGSLAVPGALKIIERVNKYITKFEKAGAKIFFTRDWHPITHSSFRENGGIWPTHCVQGSYGAEFHPSLKIPQHARIIAKGTDPRKEAYSGFDGTQLEQELRAFGITRVFICGVATEYCVRATVLDSLARGFETYLLEDAIAAVNLKPDDERRAVIEMIQKGAKLLHLEELED